MNTKKIITLLLAAVMVFCMSVPALAADAKNDSITVNNTVAGETYNLYKMFDLSVNDETNPTAYTYTVNLAWAAFFTGDNASLITKDDQGYVTGIEDAKALAKAAAKYAKDNEMDTVDSKTADSTSVVFDGLADGYYLITSTLGTVAMTETTPDKDSVTVNEKNPKDTIVKEVQEDSTSAWGKENDAQVGDTVNFRSTATLLPYTRNVKIYDTMDAGLTYNKDLVIEGLTEGTQYTVTEDDTGFVVTFTDDYINSLTENTTLNLTYTAVLNENAVATDDNGSTAIVDQNNTTKITYGDSQSVEDQTKTTTHKFNVFKHATGSEDNLAGAVFQLKKADTTLTLVKIDNNNYRVAKEGETGVDTFTTVADGDIVIWGVDADDDYTLEETTAPEGYNKLAAEVEVEVEADNTLRVDVENKSGNELPSTGGIGTTIFYVLGGLLVAFAAILLITKKRMDTRG